jgi:5-methylcytosine-specific restriction endonuclease McrA
MPYKNRIDEYAKQKEHRIKIRKLILQYLIEHPCIKCGESDPIVLDFDHLRDKTKSISRYISGHTGWKRISKEIEKCQVLCANCHRRKTYHEKKCWGKG